MMNIRDFIFINKAKSPNKIRILDILGFDTNADLTHSPEIVKDIDENLYEHLNHQPKEAWFSLSGTAYPFKPGSLLKFDAKSIHATGKMPCESKLGLTIRLDIPFK